MSSHLGIVSLLILSTLSTGSSIVTDGFGITKDNTTPQASTDYVPGVYFDRFYQIWLENIVICPLISPQLALGAHSMPGLH